MRVMRHASPSMTPTPGHGSLVVEQAIEHHAMR
jgi:hypothetical protein